MVDLFVSNTAVVLLAIFGDVWDTEPSPESLQEGLCVYAGRLDILKITKV